MRAHGRRACFPGGDETRPDQLRAIFDLEGGGCGGGKMHVRVWQLDAPGQIVTDPRIRHIAYTMATQLHAPVVAYYGETFKSFHLIASLDRFRPAIARKFPNDPIYPLWDKDMMK